MSGYCASGIAKIAIRPATVITIEMTNARRGRSMKMLEIMALALTARLAAPARSPRRRAWPRQPRRGRRLSAWGLARSGAGLSLGRRRPVRHDRRLLARVRGLAGLGLGRLRRCGRRLPVGGLAGSCARLASLSWRLLVAGGRRLAASRLGPRGATFASPSGRLRVPRGRHGGPLVGGRDGRRRFGCRHRYAGSRLLDALDDHLVARLEARLDHDLRAGDGAQGDAPGLHLVVAADHQHEGAGLVDLDRRLRHREHLHRLAALDSHVDELAVDQSAIGIGERGPHRDGIGALIDLDVEEIDLARVLVRGAVGQRDLDHRRAGRIVTSASILQELALADRKGDVDRVLADDGREHAAVGPDQVADAERGAADAAGDRRVDLGVAEIDPRPLERRLGLQDRRPRPSRRRRAARRPPPAGCSCS